jgi:hypothetical protein
MSDDDADIILLQLYHHVPGDESDGDLLLHYHCFSEDNHASGDKYDGGIPQGVELVLLSGHCKVGL